ARPGRGSSWPRGTSGRNPRAPATPVFANPAVVGRRALRRGKDAQVIRQVLGKGGAGSQARESRDLLAVRGSEAIGGDGHLHPELRQVSGERFLFGVV